VEILNYNDVRHADEWDRFVTNHSEGRFCHLSGFMRALEETYGYRQYYQLLTDRHEVVGIIPLFFHRGFGRPRLVSQPASEYGGPLVLEQTQIDPVILRDRFSALLEHTGARFIEIHGGTGLPSRLRRELFATRPLHHYGVLRLTNPDAIWAHQLSHSARKAIGKARRAGLKCYQETNEETIAKRFYPLYLRAMAQFGTPPHPRKFFLSLYNHLSANMRLFLVDHEGTTVACLLGFTTAESVHVVWTASTNEYLDMRPNDLAHWTLICWSAENGFRTFDFGPVRYAGQRQYKEKWGIELRDYGFYYFPPTISVRTPYDAPSLFTALWRRLPLSVSERLGVHVRRALAR